MLEMYYVIVCVKHNIIQNAMDKERLNPV